MVDGSSLVLEAESPPPPQVFEMLRAHKPEILELLQAERRAVVRHIANHFQSSPPGRCALCGDGKREPFRWREAQARVALGIETPVDIRPECDASYVETREK